MNHSSEEIERCISLLEDLVNDTGQLATLPEEQRIALMKVTGEISRPDRAETKRRNKAADRMQNLTTLEKDRRARNTTGIRTAKTEEVFTAPVQIEFKPDRFDQNNEELYSPRNCYICKEKFTQLHFFYDT